MRKTATKQRLLSSTLHLISEKGYLGATTREIARGAGVTELTLFRHFGTKERLFEEVLQNHTFLPRLKELLPDLDGLHHEEALKLIATRFLLSLKERKSMVTLMYSEGANYPDKIRKVYIRFIDEIRSTLASYFVSLQKQGVLRKGMSPEMAAKVFLWVLFSYFRSEEILRAGSGMTKRKMDRSVEEIMDIFLEGVRNGHHARGGNRR